MEPAFPEAPKHHVEVPRSNVSFERKKWKKWVGRSGAAAQTECSNHFLVSKNEPTESKNTSSIWRTLTHTLCHLG
jgi:hypothetical protein